MQDASLEEEMMGNQALHKDVSIKPELDNMANFLAGLPCLCP